MEGAMKIERNTKNDNTVHPGDDKHICNRSNRSFVALKWNALWNGRGGE